MVSTRGVELASLYMSGIETALFVNDICGAPIPIDMCHLWGFFDGKLFHYKMLKSTSGLPTIDVCDGSVSNSFYYLI